MLLGKIDHEEHARRLSQSDESKVEGQDPETRQLGFAQKLVEQRKFDLAIPVLTKLHTEQSGAAVAVLLGTALLEEGRIDEAAACLEPLAKEGIKSPKVNSALARLELARGNEKAAEGYLVDALERSPNKEPVLYLLGRLYERQDKLDKAVDCYRKALEEAYDERP